MCVCVYVCICVYVYVCVCICVYVLYYSVYVLLFIISRNLYNVHQYRQI